MSTKDPHTIDFDLKLCVNLMLFCAIGPSLSVQRFFYLCICRNKDILRGHQHSDKILVWCNSIEYYHLVCIAISKYT